MIEIAGIAGSLENRLRFYRSLVRIISIGAGAVARGLGGDFQRVAARRGAARQCENTPFTRILARECR